MYIFLMIIHIIVCIFLIFVILLQAGRGSGMSDMMGGGQPQSLFGTQTNVFMTRITEVCAVLFIVTSLSLGILATQRGKSLIQSGKAVSPINVQKPMPIDAPAAPATPTAVTEPIKAAETAAPAAG